MENGKAHSTKHVLKSWISTKGRNLDHPISQRINGEELVKALANSKDDRMATNVGEGQKVDRSNPLACDHGHMMERRGD